MFKRTFELAPTSHALPILLFLSVVLGLFGAALRASLRLGGYIHRYIAVVSPARGAGAMRDTHGAALALNERVGSQGMMRTAVSRMRPRMSHPHNHKWTIPNKVKKDKPRSALAETGPMSRVLGHLCPKLEFIQTHCTRLVASAKGA